MVRSTSNGMVLSALSTSAEMTSPSMAEDSDTTITAIRHSSREFPSTTPSAGCRPARPIRVNGMACNVVISVRTRIFEPM